MNNQSLQVASLLIDLERELRVLSLWDAEPPEAEALLSVQPFAVDTLTFPQWLQFIFIPKLYALIDADAALPHVSGVAPMAEQALQGTPLFVAPLITVIAALDKALTAA